MEGTSTRAGLCQPVGDEAVATLRALVRRNELFARGARDASLSSSGLAVGSATWFAVDVGARGTSGLPSDVLLLVYAQELVRRALGWEQSVVVVCDPSSAAAGVTSLDGRRATERALERLSSVTVRLGFPVMLVAAHQVARGEPLRIGATLDVQVRDAAVREQIALTEMMRRRGVTAKIGWAGAAATPPSLESVYSDCFGDGVSFLYTVDGRTLDPERRRACPSAVIRPDHRILLEPGEDVARKLATAPALAARGYRRLLEKLARAHTRLTGDRAASGVELVQSLIDSL